MTLSANITDSALDFPGTHDSRENKHSRRFCIPFNQGTISRSSGQVNTSVSVNYGSTGTEENELESHASVKCLWEVFWLGHVSYK